MQHYLYWIKGLLLGFVLILLIMLNFAMDLSSDPLPPTPEPSEDLPSCLTYYEIYNSTQVNTLNLNLRVPSRFHIKDSYLFVADKGLGIHIYDFSMESFNKVAFIALAGCNTLTVYGNYLFANAYNTLMVFDISTPEVPVYLDKKEAVFYVWPDTIYAYYDGSVELYSEELGTYLTYDENPFQSYEYFESKCSTPEVENYYDTGWFNDICCNNGDYFSCGFGCAGSDEGAPDMLYSNDLDGNAAGSMASMALIQNHLYVITLDHNLSILNAADPHNIILANSITYGTLETIFPYENYAFFGGMDGMFIYDVQDPVSPEYVAEFEHAKVCDPVVVQGDYAYVTLRAQSFGRCSGTENSLNLIDISDIYHPELVTTYPLTAPYGLAVRDENIFICDNLDTLRVLYQTGTDDVIEITQKSMPAYDIILYYDYIFTTGPDGITLSTMDSETYDITELDQLLAEYEL